MSDVLEGEKGCEEVEVDVTGRGGGGSDAGTGGVELLLILLLALLLLLIFPGIVGGIIGLDDAGDEDDGGLV